MSKQRKRKKDQDDDVSTHSLFIGDDDAPKKKKLGRVASLANIFTSPSGRMHSAKRALKKSISGMLHPAVNKDDHPETSPTPSTVSVPSSPAVSRTRGSIVSLTRLSVSDAMCMYSVPLNSVFNLLCQTSSQLTPYRPPAHTPTKHRIIRLWSETWGKTTALSLTNQEIKRQEVWQCERLVVDARFSFTYRCLFVRETQAIYELWHGECDLIEDISMLQRNYHDSLVRLGLINQV